MPKHIIGTIFTKLKGEKIAYYPKTIGTAIEDASIPFDKFDEELQDKINNGLMDEEEREILDEIINNGGSNSEDVGLPLTRYDGVVIATENNQKIFELTLEGDMPNVEKMSLDVHINSVWYSPDRYKVSGNTLTLNNDEEGLSKGEALHYTLHYGKVSGTSIGVKTQTITVKANDGNRFEILMEGYTPTDTKVMPVIGSAVIVEDRFKIVQEGNKYYIQFLDYTKFAVGKVIVLYYFSNTNALILNGGSVEQKSLSVTAQAGRTITIPVDDFSTYKYKMLVFKNGSYIAPRRYTLDLVNSNIVLKDTETALTAGEVIDIELFYVEKELNMKQNKTLDRINGSIQYKTATLTSSQWKSDTTYGAYPFAISVNNTDIKSKSLIHFSMELKNEIKYDGKICKSCECTKGSFKIFAKEKPSENINIKFNIINEGV